MKESNIEIETKVISYLSVELTESECIEIDDWRRESSENEKLFQEIRLGWEAIPLLHEMENFNSFEALKTVNNRLESHDKIHWIRSLQKIAAILIIPLILYSAYITVQNFSLIDLAEIEPVFETVTSKEGAVSHLTLSDGTKVWLNSGSTIQFPNRFTGNNREVKLTGEAFFEVVKNTKQPFLVNANELNVEVLGTSFNVACYDNDTTSEVVLVTGKVKFFTQCNNKIKQYGYIEPGQRAVYSLKTHKIYSERVEVDKYVAWRNGNLVFRDDSMNEVVKRLSRWFNVEISIVDPEIKNYIYTATFSNETLAEVLYLLKISAPIDYTILERKSLTNGEFSKQKVLLMKKK
ncbi:MAG: DUF4974 domain-containing protein [Bacteroidales bacterium]|nr:DUF4974 domain-containing protein [Bacteroidales bacterium]